MSEKNFKLPRNPFRWIDLNGRTGELYYALDTDSDDKTVEVLIFYSEGCGYVLAERFLDKNQQDSTTENSQKSED